jgi:HPt (histidine-containing phosphotransfer) domain-containing protein
LEEILPKITNSDNEDLQLYIVNIHGIKNALNNIDEKELANTANELEKAGRNRDFTVIINNTPAFLTALQALVLKFKQEEESRQSEIPLEITEKELKYLREKLLVIKSACVEFDKKTAKNELALLKQKTWPRHIKENLDIISDHLLHSAFKEAAETAENIISNI